MNRIAGLPAVQRAEIIRETAEQLQLTPSAVEKDFWVVWVLDKLFGSELLENKIRFKGGTSLSKVFGLIRRFSEDIDLILDWNVVIKEDPYLERSKTKQDEFNKGVPVLSRRYYDLAMMASDSKLKKSAFSDLSLLHTVSAFKAKFYPTAWARYDLAKPGTFHLLPTESKLSHLANDYLQMQVMFFGDIPLFFDLMEILKDLENDINALEATK